VRNTIASDSISAMGTSGEAMILMEELSAVSYQAISHRKKQNALHKHLRNDSFGQQGQSEILSSQFLCDLKMQKARIRVDARP
jgi:hypothetical protein